MPAQELRLGCCSTAPKSAVMKAAGHIPRGQYAQGRWAKPHTNRTCGCDLPARGGCTAKAAADASSLLGGSLVEQPAEEAKQRSVPAAEALWGADIVVPPTKAAMAASLATSAAAMQPATVTAKYVSRPASAAAALAVLAAAAAGAVICSPATAAPAAVGTATATAAPAAVDTATSTAAPAAVDTAPEAPAHAESRNSTPIRNPNPEPTPEPAEAAVQTGAVSLDTSPASPEASPASGSKPWWQRWVEDTQQMQEKLKSLGLAGVVAYGLFNTLYYTGMFLFVWFYVAQVPSGLGVAAASRKFLEVFAMVWAGSQVTKLARAAAAVALAPLVDAGLQQLQERLGLATKRSAFVVVLGACLGLAATLFGGVVALHA